jgi:choline transporter-like protein 2/4/5
MAKLLKCCEKPDLQEGAEKSDGKKFVEDNVFQLDTKRRCTDVLFLVLFAVVWVLMLVLAGISITKGNPYRLVYGTDWKGRECGSKGTSLGVDYDFKDKTYVAYPRLIADLIEGGNNAVVPKDVAYTTECVSSCPQIGTNYTNTKDGGLWFHDYNTQPLFYRCLPLRKETGVKTVTCQKVTVGGSTIDVSAMPDADAAKKARYKTAWPCPLDGDCYAVVLKEIPDCVTTVTDSDKVVVGPARTDPIMEQMQDGFAMVMRWIGDVQKAGVPILLCGAIAGIVFSMVWIFVVGKFAGIMVFFVVLCIVLALVGATLYLCSMGNMINTKSFCTGSMCESLQGQADDDKAQSYRIGAYVMFVVDFLVFCILIFMRSRLKLATKTVQHAAVFMNKRPKLYVFPFVPCLLSLAAFIYFLVIGAYMASCGDDDFSSITDHTGSLAISNTNNTTNYVFKGSSTMQALLVFHLFGFLWLKDLISAVVIFVVASTVAGVYWKDTEGETNGVGQGLRRVFRYHIGSLCFGSLVLAIIETIRLVIEYIDHKVQKASGNKVVKLFMCVLRVYGWCLQKCIEFISTNAYILMAHSGNGFCTSAREAFDIIIHNMVAMGTVQTITAVLILIGKVSITMGSLFLFNIYLDKGADVGALFGAKADLGTISAPILPMLMCCLLAWSVATYFLDILGTSIDTCLMCHMLDEKEYKPKFGTLFDEAPEDLKHTLKTAEEKYPMAIHKSKRNRAGRNPKGADVPAADMAPVPHGQTAVALAPAGAGAEGTV